MTILQRQPVSHASLNGIHEAKREISRRIIGMDREIELLLCAVLAGRHVLVEGVPGLGKTMLVKSLAATLGCTFKRIQFTPDLLPADILGGHVYNPKDGTFTLRLGPIFANVILGDEINRAPAKTQSAFLEVMQEHQVTIEGETVPVPQPFFVFATQNPLEHEGVYPLPQAQLDRFAIRLLVKYPSAADEQKILSAHRQELAEPQPVLDSGRIMQFQESVKHVTVSNEILTLMVSLSNFTRTRPGVTLGASPRVGLDLLHLSRARAALHDRAYVIPDDIKALFLDVANHRIALSPQAEIGGLTPEKVIDEALRHTRLV